MGISPVTFVLALVVLVPLSVTGFLAILASLDIESIFGNLLILVFKKGFDFVLTVVPTFL